MRATSKWWWPSNVAAIRFVFCSQDSRPCLLMDCDITVLFHEIDDHVHGCRQVDELGYHMFQNVLWLRKFLNYFVVENLFFYEEYFFRCNFIDHFMSSIRRYNLLYICGLLMASVLYTYSTSSKILYKVPDVRILSCSGASSSWFSFSYYWLLSVAIWEGWKVEFCQTYVTQIDKKCLLCLNHATV